ncbi:MAG: hypothetical protein R6U31_03970 [bacterium]
MKNDKLSERMNKYGYTLIESESVEENMKLLRDIAKSREYRVLEGFPVVLYNMINAGGIFCKDLSKPSKKLEALIHIAFACFHAEGKSYMLNRFKRGGECFVDEERIKKLSDQLQNKDTVRINKMKISSERILNTFRLYVNEKESQQIIEHLDSREEMELHQALNQLFPRKQKEIILKKFKGEKLTKTEKEYYSRIIKKKLKALLNKDLRRIAEKL